MRRKGLSYTEQNVNKGRISRLGDNDARPRSVRGLRDRRPRHRRICLRVVSEAEAVSSKRLDDVGDFHRHGYTLRVDCLACKRVAVLDPLDLVQRCQRNGWSRQLASVERRLRCSGCGSRRVRCGPGFK